MINVKVTQTGIKTIKPNDPNWNLISGFTVTPRAAFEISQRCPEDYKDLILECIKHGWLKPVAHLYDHELTFDLLKN